MKLKELKRDYAMSDAALLRTANQKHQSLTRDLAALAPRNVSAATLTGLQLLISNFETFPTDEELLGDEMLATQEKDKKSEELRVLIRSVRTMVQNKWGTADARYRKYGFEEVSKSFNEGLYRLGKRVARIAATQVTDLASEGLSAATITQLNTVVAALDACLDKQDDMANKRQIATQDRIKAGNLLYKEIVRLCNTASDFFSTTDAARYNDYIIYDAATAPTSSGDMPK